MEGKTYLDTHCIVWLHDKELSKFSEKALNIIESNSLYISEFVRLELQYLYEINRLKKNPQAIITFLMKTIDLSICTCTLSEIIDKSLTLSWTRDPFDRLITANAMVNNSLLLSKDETICKHYKYTLS